MLLFIFVALQNLFERPYQYSKFLFSSQHRFQFSVFFYAICFNCMHLSFQHESALYSCLNVKELLAWNRRKIWSWNDCNYTRTYNHLACKQTLNHLAKLACNVRDMIKTYSQMHCTDKYSQHSASSPVDFIHVLASDV